MTTAPSKARPNGYRSLLPTGRWRVDPTRSSSVFNARIAGRPVRGRLPLRGDVLVAELAQESTAELVASPSAVTTGHGVLDRVLAGPGFLNADNFPEITFRSEVLVCVPTGWRAIGNMCIKGTEHPVVCELAADLRSAHTAGAVTVTVGPRFEMDHPTADAHAQPSRHHDQLAHPRPRLSRRAITSGRHQDHDCCLCPRLPHLDSHFSETQCGADKSPAAQRVTNRAATRLDGLG
jgi:polyisoprenoid-binding protein YceI